MAFSNGSQSAMSAEMLDEKIASQVEGGLQVCVYSALSLRSCVHHYIPVVQADCNFTESLPCLWSDQVIRPHIGHQARLAFRFGDCGLADRMLHYMRAFVIFVSLMLKDSRPPYCGNCNCISGWVGSSMGS